MQACNQKTGKITKVWIASPFVTQNIIKQLINSLETYSEMKIVTDLKYFGINPDFLNSLYERDVKINFNV